MDCAKIGQLIFQLRTEKGLTQKQVADQLNISNKFLPRKLLDLGTQVLETWGKGVFHSRRYLPFLYLFIVIQFVLQCLIRKRPALNFYILLLMHQNAAVLSSSSTNPTTSVGLTESSVTHASINSS